MPTVLPSLARARSVMIAAALLGASLLLGACLGPQAQRSWELVNVERAQRDIPVLSHHDELQVRAQDWAEHLARTGRLAHSNLRDAPAGARVMAENVGVGSSVDAVHGLFMASDRHRANILRTDVRAGSVGVATSGDGRVWVVQLFMG